MSTPHSIRPKSIEILLVEDSDTDRMLTIEALRDARLNNVLHCVQDGEEAMRFLRRQGSYVDAPRPDLILLDLNMPRKDGREVLKDIKTDPLLCYIPVVVLTTSKADEDVLAAYGLHANCYITKPLDIGQFTHIATTLRNFWFEIVTLPPAATVGHAPLPDENDAGRRIARLYPSDRPYRVLVVEDSPSDVFLIKQALAGSPQAKFEIQQVDRVAKAVDCLRASAYDVIISDLGLPDSQGGETVRTLMREAGDIPLIVLTMLDDEATGLAMLHEGATDYIVKGQISERALARAIRYAVDRRQMEEQLRMSQRMESIGVLASGVAHDFNNLLTIIRGNAELQLLGDVAEAQRISLSKQILSAAERASRLTRQLLTFSRHQRMTPVDADLNAVVGEFTKMLRRMIGPNIRLELQLAGKELPVHCDIGMIEQVVMNLAVNARDAMPAGGRLTICTNLVALKSEHDGEMPPAGPGDYARMVVSDVGGGISPHMLKRIFEPFFTTKDAGKGTGLGLSTVYGIVRQHRGSIHVTSELGAGTAFTVMLPLRTRDAMLENDEARGLEAPAGGSETILLVDDEEMVLEVATTVLQSVGYFVVTAKSGTEALAKWSEWHERVDLLLTDLAMPDGIGGAELADRLTAEKPGLRVVYSSGFGSGGVARGLQLRAGENFIAKPYSLTDLLDVVRLRLDSPPEPVETDH